VSVSHALLKRTLVDAYSVLARMIHDEFPSDMSLVEIVETWGDASKSELAALRRVENQQK
jgi:hypothetical protein